jgi:hypothetical protein
MIDNLPQAFDAIYNNAKKRLWKALALKMKAIRKAHKEENNFIDNLDPILDEENQPIFTNDGKPLT